MKTLMNYKRFKIKEATKKEREEEGTYRYCCCKYNEVEFEADSLIEIFDFIDTYDTK